MNVRKRLATLASIFLLLAFIASGTGCPRSTPTPSPSPSLSPTFTLPSGETLQGILNRAGDIALVRYDQIATAPGQSPAIQRWFIKGNKVRTEMNVYEKIVVSLIDADTQTAYLYIPEENRVKKMDLQQQERTFTSFSVVEWSKLILISSRLQAIGAETLEGKDCVLVQFTELTGQRLKAWIWKERGIPLRVEAVSGSKFTIDWLNIEFVDIPDSMFELPAGVEIQEQ